MLRSLLTSLLALTLLLTPSAGASPSGAAKTPAPVSRASSLVVKLVVEGGVCSGFPVGTIHYVTAAHCVEDVNQQILVLGAEGRQIGVVGRIDKSLDLASFDVPEAVRAFKVAKRFPPHDQLTWLLGFPATSPLMFAIEAFPLGPYMHPEDGLKEGYSNPAYGGMSGGPIIDQHGDVIGVVQEANGQATLGAPLEALQQFVSRIQ